MPEYFPCSGRVHARVQKTNRRIERMGPRTECFYFGVEQGPSPGKLLDVTGECGALDEQPFDFGRGAGGQDGYP